MSRERAVDPGVEEDFLYHLFRGGELLGAGKVVEALAELERAHDLRPDSAKAKGLLGLACFKLGQLDRAALLYEDLTRDNPIDATLRINLGLVFLKTGKLDLAIRELSTAAELAPDHAKGWNYLGLAYAQAGDDRGAIDAFRRAGNQPMVARLERHLGAAEHGQPSRGDDSRQGARIIELPAGRAEASNRREADPEEEFSLDVEIEPEPLPSAAPPVPAPRPAAAAPPPKAVALAGPLPPPAAPGLGDLLKESNFELRAKGDVFELQPAGALLRVSGELHARLSQVAWIRGPIQHSPEQKRFRGRATDKPFGEGEDRLQLLSGHGELFVSRRGFEQRILDLGEEAIYLLEDLLFAFEDGLSYENGRLASPGLPDVLLVHLRGRGKALLRIRGTLASLPIRPEAPARIPVERLVGWTAGLTPTLLPEGQAAGRWMQLDGEGWALWSLPTP